MINSNYLHKITFCLVLNKTIPEYLIILDLIKIKIINLQIKHIIYELWM